MQINTLSEFLTQAGTEFRLFDLGRRLQAIEPADFLAIEAQQRPYPWPLQRHAWLAVCYWQTHSPEQPYIWFLKLPLDERGLFNNGAVKYFLAALVEQLGQDLTAPLSDEQQQKLAQTPFTFAPSQEKLAAFHARLGLALNTAPSHFYQGTLDFLATPEQHDWQQLGLQGLAEVAARLQQDVSLSQLLARQWPQLPVPVQTALCQQCEHQPLPDNINHLLLDAVNHELERHTPDDERIALLLRATAASPAFVARQQKIATLLSLAPSQALMLCLVARLWQELTDETLLLQYLSQLAERHGDLFNGVFSELVSMPALRPLILSNLHNATLAPALKDALGALYTADA
ncbi:hypothetical protein CBP31_13335 [Oceanisphaera profunda]|uniref:DUF3549 domain-containing protein n=1 Tax=Oceanisphaera profunda TaxID=1416627 RepID=A0A1Y0D887_9GAMM|nr:DUF3549 family protein [Oceanisphaera profunda]ART83484.1 hypothetical protein CBP31_13335 [Oceanisphaera profunda]